MFYKKKIFNYYEFYKINNNYRKLTTFSNYNPGGGNNNNTNIIFISIIVSLFLTFKNKKY